MRLPDSASLSMRQPRVTHRYMLRVRPFLPLTQLRVLLGEASGNLPSLSTTQPRVPHAYLLRVLPSQPLAQPRVPHASMPFLPRVERPGTRLSVPAKRPSFAIETV